MGYPIRGVWQGVLDDADPELWDGMDYHDGVKYHTMNHYRLVFEVASGNMYLSCGPDGIKPYTLEELKAAGLHLSDKVDLSELIFKDQWIYFIRDTDSGYVIVMNDFELRVIVHPEDDYEGEGYQIDVPFSGMDHVLQPCTCGGKACFMMNKRSDFYIVCSQCNRTSIEGYIASLVVNDWNASNRLEDLLNGWIS